MTFRSGIGVDVHPLVEGRPLLLGGVSVPFEKGLLGHSDGDALVHAVIDALLGGAGLGDIGAHFPSSEPRYEGADSGELLVETVRLLAESGWRATYVDATILAERPPLSPYIGSMRQSLAGSLNVQTSQVNVKAKTTDGLGFLGKGEGVAALVVATLQPTE